MNLGEKMVERNHCLPSLRQNTTEIGARIQSEKALKGRHPSAHWVLHTQHCLCGGRKGVVQRARHQWPLTSHLCVHCGGIV